MMNLNTITAVVLSVMVGSSVDLNTEKNNSSTSKPSEINAAAKTNAPVVIDDFSQEIYSWWTGSEGKYILKRTDNEDLLVTVTDAGNKSSANGYHTFGRQFDAVDFSKNPVLKIKMKATGGSPKIRIDLKDANGMVANKIANVVTVPAGGEYVDYYFDFTGKWNQEWPSPDVVDPVEIVELLMYVNPGGPSFTGTVSIDDIYAVSVADKK